MSQKLLISSCLIGKKCAYDGRDRYDPEVASLAKACDFVDICPELSAGLGCPRVPHEISGGDGNDVLSGDAAIITESSQDYTQEFLLGAQNALDLAINNNIRIAVLKSKSPSCGTAAVYSGRFDGKLNNGMGVTAALLKRNNINIYNENEITALKIHLQML